MLLLRRKVALPLLLLLLAGCGDSLPTASERQVGAALADVTVTPCGDNPFCEDEDEDEDDGPGSGSGDDFPEPGSGGGDEGDPGSGDGDGDDPRACIAATTALGLAVAAENALHNTYERAGATHSRAAARLTRYKSAAYRDGRLTVAELERIDALAEAKQQAQDSMRDAEQNWGHARFALEAAKGAWALACGTKVA